MLTHIFLAPELVRDLIELMMGLPAAELTQFTHIFVDESHCVVKWGQSDGKSQPFRKAYDSIGGLRAILPQVVMVAMTATAPTSVVTNIKVSLNMNPECSMIRVSPNRPNIRYSTKRLSTSSLHEAFHSLVHYVSNTPPDVCEKVLIFCRQLKHIGLIYNYLKSRCPPDAVQMFHKKTSTSVQTDICKRICEASALKIVVCSSSFSMGLDIPDLHYVIHYGMPCELDEYVQEAGRVGRDGKQSHAMVLIHKDSNKGSNMSQTVKHYASTDSCLRSTILSYFADNTQACDMFSPTCCSNCWSKSLLDGCCNCGNSTCSHVFASTSCYCVKWCHGSFSGDIDKSLPGPSVRQVVRGDISAIDISNCREKMLALSSSGNAVLPSHLSSQIYPKLIENVLVNYRSITSVADIVRLGAFSTETAQHLFDVLEQYSVVENASVSAHSFCESLDIGFSDDEIDISFSDDGSD